MRVRLLTLAALLAVTGCARYWAKPGGTPEAFDASKARCEAETFAHYPPIHRFAATDYELIVPKPDLCVDGLTNPICMHNGGKFVPMTFPARGMSEPARDTFQACMTAAGWQPVRNAVEGDSITRGLPPAHRGG